MLYYVCMCMLLFMVIGCFGVWGKMNLIVMDLGNFSLGIIGVNLWLELFKLCS